MSEIDLKLSGGTVLVPEIGLRQADILISDGRIAAATSTGGTQNKLAGRVGVNRITDEGEVRVEGALLAGDAIQRLKHIDEPQHLAKRERTEPAGIHNAHHRHYAARRKPLQAGCGKQGRPLR